MRLVRAWKVDKRELHGRDRMHSYPYGRADATSDPDADGMPDATPDQGLHGAHSAPNLCSDTGADQSAHGYTAYAIAHTGAHGAHTTSNQFSDACHAPTDTADPEGAPRLPSWQVQRPDGNGMREL